MSNNCYHYWRANGETLMCRRGRSFVCWCYKVPPVHIQSDAGGSRLRHHQDAHEQNAAPKKPVEHGCGSAAMHRCISYSWIPRMRICGSTSRNWEPGTPRVALPPRLCRLCPVPVSGTCYRISASWVFTNTKSWAAKTYLGLAVLQRFPMGPVRPRGPGRPSRKVGLGGYHWPSGAARKSKFMISV